MQTITLSDGRLKHTLEGWTGYQNSSEPMSKTKWYKDGSDYWEIQGSSNHTYVVTRNEYGNMSCECIGYRFHRKCKHITEVLNG